MTPGSPSTGIRLLRRRGRMHFFSANHFKNWLFLSLACGKSTRMTAKLRPLWGVKQRRQSVRVNFPRARPRNSTIFSQVCGKRMQPNPAPQKPDVRVWGTRCHRRGRRNGICGGLSSNDRYVITRPGLRMNSAGRILSERKMRFEQEENPYVRTSSLFWKRGLRFWRRREKMERRTASLSVYAKL